MGVAFLHIFAKMKPKAAREAQPGGQRKGQGVMMMQVVEAVA